MEAIDIVKSIHTLFMEMKMLGFFCSSNWLRLVISFKFLTGNKRWRVMIAGDATFKWYRRSSSLGPESISTDWMAVSKVRCASRVELILEPLGVRWLSRRFLANFTIAMQMPPARAHTELAVKLSHRSGWQWLEVSGKKKQPNSFSSTVWRVAQGRKPINVKNRRLVLFCIFHSRPYRIGFSRHVAYTQTPSHTRLSKVNGQTLRIYGFLYLYARYKIFQLHQITSTVENRLEIFPILLCRRWMFTHSADTKKSSRWSRDVNVSHCLRFVSFSYFRVVQRPAGHQRQQRTLDWIHLFPNQLMNRYQPKRKPLNRPKYINTYPSLYIYIYVHVCFMHIVMAIDTTTSWPCVSIFISCVFRPVYLATKRERERDRYNGPYCRRVWKRQTRARLSKTTLWNSLSHQDWGKRKKKDLKKRDRYAMTSNRGGRSNM